MSGLRERAVSLAKQQKRDQLKEAARLYNRITGDLVPLSEWKARDGFMEMKTEGVEFLVMTHDLNALLVRSPVTSELITVIDLAHLGRMLIEWEEDMSNVSFTPPPGDLPVTYDLPTMDAPDTGVVELGEGGGAG